jgi:hypothetical protein
MLASARERLEREGKVKKEEGKIPQEKKEQRTPAIV